MVDRRVFLLLKNVFIFLINRLYKEWLYMSGNGRSFSAGASDRGDLYAKQLIENIFLNRARKYNPYMVDGISAISYGKSSVLLGQAHVTGLSTLHRTNICSLTDVGKRVFINGTFGAGPLTYQREIVFKFGDFKRNATVLVTLINIKVSVDFSIDKETGKNGFLQNFAVNELNGFNLSIKGLGYFDWTTNFILSFLTLVLGRMVRNLLENELEQYILHKLPKYQFPVEGASYKNGNKFNIAPEVESNEALLSETFYIKRNCEMPKRSRASPIPENSTYDVGKGYNLIEYGTVKELRCNLENTETSRSFLQTNNWTEEVDSSCLPEQSLGLCNRSLHKYSCNCYKSEEDWDRFTALSRETLNISRSLNEIKEKLVSISHITNSSNQGTTSKNRLEDACSLFDWNMAGELNDKRKTEPNSGKSAASGTSSPKKGFGLKGLKKVSFLECERRKTAEKETKMEYLSQMLRDSCRDLVEMASQNFNGKLGRLDDIFSEIPERYCRKNIDEKALKEGIKLLTNVVNYDSSPSTKMQLSQIDVNVLEREAETFNAESGTFLDLAVNRTEKMFIEEISDLRNRKTENLNKNQCGSCTHYQSPEDDFSAPNIDLKLYNAEMFQNEFLGSCIDDDLAKDLKVSIKVLGPENEMLIEDSESIKSNYTEMFSGNQGVEMPETRFISNPDNRIDGNIRLKSNIIFDAMEPAMIKDEKNFISETETISTSFQFREKYEDEVDEKNTYKYVKGRVGEDELNKDSLFKADEGYTSDSQRNSEKLNASIFQYEDTTHNTLLEKLASLLNERDTECTECVVEFSSIAEKKLNADSYKNSWTKTPDLKALHVLQKEIIAKTLKLKSDMVLESDSEDNEYLDSFPVSRYKNLEFETESLGHDEVNRLLQNDSRRNYFEVPCLLNGDRTSLSAAGSSTIRY